LLESFGRERKENLLTSPEQTDIAYILYTSGSTGLPKGIAILHRAVVNLLESMADLTGISANDTWLAVTTISFDIAVPELFLALLTGAQVEIAPQDVASDGYRLRRLLEQRGATLMQATPSTWRMLMESGWQGSARVRGLCGGEAMTPDLAAALRPKVGRLWNLYGPTETTVWSSSFEVPPEVGSISIGRPLANTQL
jgi:non-ribosomal peptide synthetase component F